MAALPEELYALRKVTTWFVPGRERFLALGMPSVFFVTLCPFSIGLASVGDSSLITAKSFRNDDLALAIP